MILRLEQIKKSSIYILISSTKIIQSTAQNFTRDQTSCVHKGSITDLNQYDKGNSIWSFIGE